VDEKDKFIRINNKKSLYLGLNKGGKNHEEDRLFGLDGSYYEGNLEMTKGTEDVIYLSQIDYVMEHEKVTKY
jgi:hypothetical protein